MNDIDLNFRCAKLKVGGSNGGHNGLKFIQQTLGTKDFARLCIGAGRPPNRELGGDVVNWALGRFPKFEKANLKEFFDQAVQHVNDVVESGLARAQARLHLGNPRGNVRDYSKKRSRTQ